MKSSRRSLIGVLLAALILTQAACDDAVKRIAENTKRVATLIDSARQVKNSLETSRLITEDQGKAITQGLLKANSALDAFNKRARSYATASGISVEGKADLKRLAEDIGGALTELVNDETLGVKSAEAKERISLAIAAVQEVVKTIVSTIDEIKAKPAQGV